MTSGASLFVVIVVLTNILLVGWLLWWTRRHRGPSTTTTETTGHVWDGDLTELNNPLPRWWLWLFIITVIFALIYLVLYPGLGNYGGSRGWSQIEQYQKQNEQAEAVLARTFAPFEKQTITALAEDPAALRVGRNLFLNNCATCHGSDGRGAPGFPNLTDNDWLWGGDAERVMETIAHGRSGMMMAWEPVLGDIVVEDLLAYVFSLSGRQIGAGDVARGQQKFAEVCIACHGVEGRGNALIGAPNLTDHTWLHGGSVAAVRESIAHGRQGQMPAQLERLGETRVKLLAAYVTSLRETTTPAVAAKTVASLGEVAARDGTDR